MCKFESTKTLNILPHEAELNSVQLKVNLLSFRSQLLTNPDVLLNYPKEQAVEVRID